MSTCTSISTSSFPSVARDNRFYIAAKDITDSINGKPLIFRDHECNISAFATLDKTNFKALVCCVYNACHQHKFMIANRILSAVVGCILNTPKLFTLPDRDDMYTLAVNKDNYRVH